MRYTFFYPRERASFESFFLLPFQKSPPHCKILHARVHNILPLYKTYFVSNFKIKTGDVGNIFVPEKSSMENTVASYGTAVEAKYSLTNFSEEKFHRIHPRTENQLPTINERSLFIP